MNVDGTDPCLHSNRKSLRRKPRGHRVKELQCGGSYVSD